jgi:hypothetical protein
MRSESVVLLPPPFDDHLGLFQGIEYLSVEQLISQFSIEGFVVSVFPGAGWLDEQGLDSDPLKPAPDRLSSKFGPIV